MTGPLVLEARHLAMVLAVLAEHLPEAELRVFGSRATGKAHRHSDLDLLVVGPADLPWQRLMAAEEAFAESDLPFSVDLVEAWKADADFPSGRKACPCGPPKPPEGRAQGHGGGVLWGKACLSSRP